MQLTEQHVINRDDPRWAVIDEACFKSKNLSGAALYLVMKSLNIGSISSGNKKRLSLGCHELPVYSRELAAISQELGCKLHSVQLEILIAQAAS